MSPPPGSAESDGTDWGDPDHQQLIGARLCRYLDAALFKKIVLLFLALVGVSLLI